MKSASNFPSCIITHGVSYPFAHSRCSLPKYCIYKFIQIDVNQGCIFQFFTFNNFCIVFNTTSIKLEELHIGPHIHIPCNKPCDFQ